ncbi:MAG: hypothetical protein CMI18_08600 [Opitutaceae bacterium]|nr:hypothetical protein [Opitutaceae bacterium]|tara:strand:+ start:5677 stop:5892 length:216 start_codon:yes stop_codon:yes gene_type:complete
MLKAKFNPDELDTPPKALAQINPHYPSELTRSKIEGHVSVVYVVTEKGDVTAIRITEATHRAFVDAVIATL